jgi:hypothetical protein
MTVLPSGFDRDGAARLTQGLLAQLSDSPSDDVPSIPHSKAQSMSASGASDPSESKPGVIAA